MVETGVSKRPETAELGRRTVALCPPSFHSYSVPSLLPLSSLPISSPITHLLKAFSDVYSSFLRKNLVYKTHLGRAAWLPGILVFCFPLTPQKKTQGGAEILYFYFLWS